MTCRGICTRIEAHKKNGFYYIHKNHKRCSVCCTNIETELVKCPCCSFLLRTRPRNTKSKKKITEQLTESLITEKPIEIMITSAKSN